jgi:phosphoribosylglycinamide formyltransferase-1
MKSPFRIAVLASTRGTDLQAIIDEIKGRRMKGIELVLVASDQKDCYALQRAQEQGFETAWIDPLGKKRIEFDAEMVRVLDEKQVDLVVLVGFMRILSSVFVNHYKHRILNVHPSLLPKYGGKGFLGDAVHQAVLESGDPVTGMTIHFVDEGCDSGPIVHQVEVPVEPGDNVEILRGKVQVLEKKWYPEVIRWIAHGKIVLGED